MIILVYLRQELGAWGVKLLGDQLFFVLTITGFVEFSIPKPFVGVFTRRKPVANEQGMEGCELLLSRFEESASLASRSKRLDICGF